MFAPFRLRRVASWLLYFLVFCPGPQALLALTAGLGGGGAPPPARSAVLEEGAGRRAEAMARVATGLLVAENDPDESFRHYRRAHDLDPSQVSLSLEIARLHLQREEVPEALAVLKDALKLNPKSASLALRIAGIYVVSLRKFEPAERYTRQALGADPDGIEPYQMLFSIYRADGRPGEAVALLQEAARRAGNQNAAFWAGLGDLSIRQSVMDGHLRDSGKATLALGHYRKAAELGRQDPAVLLRALNFFFAGNHLEDAVATARRLLVLQPSAAQSREKLALALAALGREGEAQAELEAVTAENPASLLAYRAHGELLLKRGDASGALEKFEKALLLHDEDPRLYLEIVGLCVRTENPERAASWLSRAREKFTTLPDLPFYEAQLLGHLKRWREALNAMDVAAALAARYQPSFLNTEFYFQHGVVAERAGQHEAAVQHFLSCLEMDDRHAAALNYLGYLWAERGENLADAEKFIRRALAAEPDNAAYLDSLGWTLYQQGRYHEALEPLERAAKISSASPDPTIEEHLGDVCEKLGRHKEAVQAWERAAALEGASEGVAGKLQAARAGQSGSSAEAKAAKP
jgi:Tfp pilus assembly protein PilF